LENDVGRPTFFKRKWYVGLVGSPPPSIPSVGQFDLSFIRLGLIDFGRFLPFTATAMAFRAQRVSSGAFSSTSGGTS